jgi:hypothetical protein
MRCTLGAFGRTFDIFGVYLPYHAPRQADVTLEQLSDLLPPSHSPAIVLGDFNAHIRISTSPQPRRHVATTNSRGHQVSDWATRNALKLTSAYCRPKRGHRRWTWRSEDRALFSTIDHVFVNHRSSQLGVTSTTFFTQVDTDHRLLAVRIPNRVHHRAALPGLSLQEALPPRGDAPIDLEWASLEQQLLQQQPRIDPSLHLPPYVSQRTLQHVENLREAKRNNTISHRRRQLHNYIRRSMRQDRRAWLSALAVAAAEEFSKNHIHAAFTLAQVLYRKRQHPLMSSTAVINKTRSYFSTLLSRGVPSFTPPPADAEPLLPFARPPPLSHDVITVYTDGSYFEGQIGIGIASTDPRIARTFSSRMGTAFPLTPDIVIGAVASPATTFSSSRPIDVISPFHSVIADGFHVDQPDAYVAEVTAAVAAVLATPDGCSLHIISDNQAVVALLGRLPTLRTVRHLRCHELWQVILQESLRVNISAEWTRGHTGTVGNEIADTASVYGRVHSHSPPYHSPVMAFLAGYPLMPVRVAISDDPPDDLELTRATSHLRTYRAAGPGGVQAATVKAVTHDTDSPQLKHDLFAFIRKCYDLGELPLSLLDGVMHLIPKGAKLSANPDELRGITVLPTCSKILLNVLSERFMATPLHPSQHGFVKQLSTVHAAAELKLRIRRHRLERKRLVAVYLDVAKAYDSVDRTALLYALRAQGAGPKLIKLVSFMLAHERTVLKLGGRYSRAFRPERGTRQGDPCSPSLFDFVMDLVICEFVSRRPTSSLPILYADDTALTSEDPEVLQEDVNVFSEILSQYGMRLNPTKSKFQVFYPARNRTTLQSIPGQSSDDRRAEKVECSHCHKRLRRDGLKQHRLTRTCRSSNPGPIPPDADVVVRVADLTDSDDDSVSAIVARQQARSQFGLDGKCYYIEGMPDNKGNPSTPCLICRGPNPACFTDRAALARHYRGVHAASAIFDETDNTAHTFAKCAACHFPFRRGSLTKHSNSAYCRLLQTNLAMRACIRRAFTPVPTLTVDGVAVGRVQVFKYLGILFTSDGADDSTIEHNRLRACRAYSHIRGLVTSDPGMPMNQRRAFVSVVVCSSLLYGCETWALNQYRLRKLRTAQQSFLRPISDLRYSVLPDGSVLSPSVEQVLTATGATHIENLVRRRRLAFAIKIFSDPRCLANSSARELIGLGLSPDAGDALHTDWLTQVRFDAQLVGVDLGIPYTQSIADVLDSFDFVGSPLTAAGIRTPAVPVAPVAAPPGDLAADPLQPAAQVLPDPP